MTGHDRHFLPSFILLSLVSGLTIGLGKIVTTLFAIDLGADAFEVGVVSAMESVGMVLVTVPAGFVIARYGARRVYFIASLGPMLVNLAMPFAGGWAALAAGRGLIGLCIPFRIVSMNSSFLERLPALGAAKAGWYRGALTGGMAIVGPAVALALSHRLSPGACFALVAALFGLMALFSLSFLPRQVRDAGSSEGFVAQLRALLADRDIAESCAIELLSSATGALFATFIILVAKAMPGLTEQDGVRLLLFQGFASVTLLFSGGALVQRLPARAGYAVGLALAAAALTALGAARGFTGLAAGAVLLSAGAAVVHLVNVRLLVAAPGAKSKVAGLYNLASMLGSTAGALAGGAIARSAGVQAVFHLWLPVLLVAAAVIEIRRRRPAPFQEGALP